MGTTKTMAYLLVLETDIYRKPQRMSFHLVLPMPILIVGVHLEVSSPLKRTGVLLCNQGRLLWCVMIDSCIWNFRGSLNLSSLRSHLQCLFALVFSHYSANSLKTGTVSVSLNTVPGLEHVCMYSDVAKWMTEVIIFLAASICETWQSYKRSQRNHKTKKDWKLLRII